MALRNVDFTDRELLHVIADACGPDGLASSDEIAARIGIGENGSNRSPAGKVATRLAWMANYGFIESIDPKEAGVERKDTRSRLWAITDVGEQIMGGRLSKAVESALERMDPGAQVLFMREISERTFGRSGRAVAAAVRREYLHQYARHSR